MLQDNLQPIFITYLLKGKSFEGKREKKNEKYTNYLHTKLVAIKYLVVGV